MSSSSLAIKIITLDDSPDKNKKAITAGTNRKRKSPSSTTTMTTNGKATTNSSSPPKKKKSPSKQKPTAPSCSYELKIPTALISSTIQKTMLVQITPEQQSNFDLEFEGSSGAIGRFEATDKHVTLDLKGHQFCGLLHSGPTAMIVSLVGNKPGSSNKKSISDESGNDSNEQQRVAKVEAIMNEFVTLEQTQDIMSMLDGTVDKGTIGNDDGNDGDDVYEEEDGDGSSNENSSNMDDKDTTSKEHTNKTKNKEKKSNVRQKKATTNRRKS